MDAKLTRHAARPLAAVALAIAALLATGAADGRGATALPRVPADCVHGQVRPGSIILACGDGNFRLERMRWTAWGTAIARGTGLAELNDCTPNCAAGRFRAYPARVTLARPGPCAGDGAQFRAIELRYPGRRPPRTARRVAFGLACPLR
jgi:hypothetical protein